jgi:predicted HD superfamily hydrolase involved in NAD metabolism
MCPSEVAGVPDTLTLEKARDWVKPRVSAKRFAHIEGVVKVARELSQTSGIDPFPAELASWLHDGAKEVKANELVQKAAEYGLKVDPIEKKQGHILHGPVAAEIVKRELGVTNEEILDAIREHTLGAIPMTTLSKVVFLADCLEESRPKEYTNPIRQALNSDGRTDMDAAVLKACDLNIAFLLSEGKPIHPRTILVRNYFLDSANV